MKGAIGLLDSSGQELSIPAGGELAWLSATALHEYGRTENQDNLVVVDAAGQGTVLRDQQPLSLQHPDWPSGRLRLAVLDGMGGHAAGREVAEQAASMIAALPAFGTPAELYQALDELHQRLREFHAQNTRALRPPGTTLTLLEIPEFASSGCDAWLYHVGDSRLYEVPPAGPPKCLTIDHVPATELAIQGFLSEADWLRQVHEEPHSTISQAFAMGGSLGLRDNRFPVCSDSLVFLGASNLPPWLYGRDDRRTLRLNLGQIYLLATDGLWNIHEPVEHTARWPAPLSGSRGLRDRLSGLLHHVGNVSRNGDDFYDNITILALQLHG